MSGNVTLQRSGCSPRWLACACFISALLWFNPASGLEPVAIELDSGETLMVDAGTVLVPENRNDPDSREIAIGFYRIKGADGAGEIPMVMVPGGPGGSYLAYLDEGGRRQSFTALLIDLYRQHGDVVLIDLRGLNASTPNALCDGPPDKWQMLDSKEDFVRIFEEASVACRDKLIAEGFDLAGYTVLEAAADVVAVIDHLGYEKFNIYGNSFGSHWSMTVVRYHADRVNRAIITAVEGYDHTYDDPRGVRQAVQAIAEQAAPAWQAAGREGDPLQALDALFAASADDPEMANGMQPYEITTFGFDGMDYGVTQRAPAEAWPAAVADLVDGGSWLIRMGAKLFGARFIGAGDSAAVWALLDCSSGISAARRSDLEADRDPLFSDRSFMAYDAACPAWGIAELPPEFQAGEAVEVPVLFAHGDIDAATPLRNALEMTDAFANAHLITIENGTHGAFVEALRHTEEMRPIVSAWLDGTAPTISRLTVPPLEFEPIPEP
ncbi:MAG: alpha/beta fold hydrolase [Pseudomonadota bacterium]